MTPEPKYLAMKKAQSGIRLVRVLRAKMGKQAPNREPIQMTKIAETRTLRFESSKLFPVLQEMVTKLAAAAAAVVAAAGMPVRAAIPPML